MSRFSVVFLCLIWGVHAHALTLTLESTPTYGLAHNPTLAAARLRIAEARGRLLGSGRWTNPELEVEYMQNLRMPERSIQVAFTQRFPLTARLRLEKAVSRSQVAVAEAEVREVERKLAAEIGAAVVKAVALREQRDLREQQLANSRKQADIVTKRVAVGESSVADALLLELETAQLGVELVQLTAAQAVLVGELRPMLGVSAGERLEITGKLGPVSALPPKGAGVQGRADLDAARHRVAAARSSFSLAQSRKWEDLGVGFTARGEQTQDAPEGFSNDHFLGLRLSLPLPIWNQNEGQIAEAAAVAKRTALEGEALAFTIRNESAAARAEMAALANLVSEFDDKLLPKAAQLEAQLRSAYTSAQAPLTEVLRAGARRLELAQRRLDALRDYHLARVRYQSTIGHRPTSGGKDSK